MIWPILEARAEIEKYFRSFLVQMKTSKFTFEINWPLEKRTKFRSLKPKQITIEGMQCENRNKSTYWPVSMSPPSFGHSMLSRISQWIRMGILIWFMVGVKYYSHIWFLHTIGLLRYHGPQDNWKRPRNFSKAIPKATLPFYWNFIIFLPYVDHFDLRIQPIEEIWPPLP
jgi:hypothetical protein